MYDNGLEWGIADEYLESWENKNKLKNEMLKELIKKDSKYLFLKEYIDELQSNRDWQERQSTLYFNEKTKAEYLAHSYKLLFNKLKTKCSVLLRIKDKLNKSEADNKINKEIELYKRLYNISEDI